MDAPRMKWPSRSWLGRSERQVGRSLDPDEADPELAHERGVLDLAPQARGKVYRIGKFGGFDVPDPYLRPRAAFEDALALIETGISDFEKAFGDLRVKRNPR